MTADPDRDGFLRRARRHGFTAAEADDLVRVRRLTGACAAFQGMIQAKRRELRRRIAELEAREGELSALLVACWTHEAAGPCPVRWDFRPSGDEGGIAWPVIPRPRRSRCGGARGRPASQVRRLRRLGPDSA